MKRTRLIFHLNVTSAILLTALQLSCAADEQAQAAGRSEVLTSITCPDRGHNKQIILTKEGAGSSARFCLTRHVLKEGKPETEPDAVIWEETVTYGNALPKPAWTIGVSCELDPFTPLNFCVAHLSSDRFLTVRFYGVPMQYYTDRGAPKPELLGTFKKQMQADSPPISRIRMEAAAKQVVFFLQRRIGDERKDRWPTICVRFDIETKQWTEVNLYGDKVDADNWKP